WAALRYRAAAVLSQDRAWRAGISRRAGVPRDVGRSGQCLAEHERCQFRQPAQGCERVPGARYLPRAGLPGERLRRPRRPGVLPVPRPDLLGWPPIKSHERFGGECRPDGTGTGARTAPRRLGADRLQPATLREVLDLVEDE